jgi:catechol 2,3-dioxygenase-like lactoylglutathione lyase family enzyme
MEYNLCTMSLSDFPKRKESSMKRLIWTLSLAVLLAPLASWAEIPPPNTAGVSNGHWHLNVRDVEANTKFFVAMGGTALKDQPGVIEFPDVVVRLRAQAPTGGSVGTVINHVGFLVPNVQQSVAKWKAAGLKTEPGNRPEQSFVYTPDDLKIEILEEKSMTVPIKNHHVHFYVSESAIPEMQAWYVKTFGAKPGMRGQFQAADIPGVNLSFAKSDTPTVPTKGRVLDHIGFEVKHLEAFCKKLEANGIKLDRPYGKTDTGVGIAFITDPWGTQIELNEHF